MKNLFQKILIISLLLNLTKSVQFAFKIPANKIYCTGEYITENTVALFGMISNSNRFKAEIYDPKNKILYSKTGELEIKLSLTAAENGNHQVCITNNDRKEIQIDFEFLSGIQAQDYTDIAKESNLKPVETSVKKVEDTINLLIKDLTSVTKEEDKSLAESDNINSNVISFSVITVGCMILIGAVETLYLKRYLHKRKII